LILGVFTHYALDLLMLDGGMSLLYPFTPLKWQIGIISVTDYNLTIISIITASIIYYLYKKVI
jgi:membrane-bound metal-dependent hydrolase YbcI (DUF457 family)